MTITRTILLGVVVSLNVGVGFWAWRSLRGRRLTSCGTGRPSHSREAAKSAVDPAPIDKMIAIIEKELGFYEAAGQVKWDPSSAQATRFRFSGAGQSIEAEVAPDAFERWIAPDIDQVERAIDHALSQALTSDST